MIGKVISHYRILEKLGEGGMGEVYKALDVKLNRPVALKFLPLYQLPSKEDVHRFQQEAKVLSSLSHPHIATIYDIDEAEGEHFIALEYLPGGTLRAKVKKLLATGDQLSLANMLTYALQLSEALDHAHRRGIIHCDVKTDNMMLTEDGWVKLTDFGVARLLGGAELSEKRLMAGTIAYMAPEQLMGEELDQRSDLFSFGISLYELATGYLPFRGDHQAALRYSILNEDPLPIKRFRPDLPGSLEQLIVRSIEKDKAKRFQTGEDVAAALRSVKQEISEVRRGRSPGKKSPIRSIAVLPFENMSTDPENAYFSDGMTEELINALTKIQSLRVAARTSVFSFKGKNEDVRTIGKHLNVSTVLEGSVRKVGNKLRVMAQLVSVEDGYHLWSEKYDSVLDDIFAIQDGISRAIVNTLKVTLGVNEETILIKRPTESLDAYQLYLKGRFYWNERTGPALKKSLEYFAQATEKDPNYALAFAGLSDCYVLLGWYSDLPPLESFSRARSAALRALERDPTLAEAHASLAAIKEGFDWDFDSAEVEFQQAINLNPNYSTAHQWYGLYLSRMGRFEEGIKELQRALEIDPFSLMINVNVGTAYYLARRYEDAIGHYRHTLEMDSSFAPAHAALGQTLRQLKKYDEAIKELLLANVSGDEPWTLANLVHTYCVSGNRKAGLEILHEIETMAARRYVPAVALAIAYNGLGDTEATFKWLQKGFDERSGFWFLLRGDPVFDNLRSDSRFQGLLKKVGLPP